MRMTASLAPPEKYCLDQLRKDTDEFEQTMQRSTLHQPCQKVLDMAENDTHYNDAQPALRDY
jgi:hypothetical protein